MAERKIHLDLEQALEKNLPQTYLPPEIARGLMGEEIKEDNFKALSLGVRISPKAMRSLLLMTLGGFYDEDGRHIHTSSQFRLNAMAYGFFHDFLTQDDIPTLTAGKIPREYLAQSEKDLYVGPNFPKLGNKVFGSLEEVALDIERRRTENPELVVLLLHGKWNTIPHPGHIFAQRDMEEDMAIVHGIDYKNMVTVIMADTNKEIAETENQPYLTTLWRVSLMSYSPYVDYVCPSGDFSLDKADAHWSHKYKLLRPFAIHVARDHPKRDIVVKRCLEVGAIPVAYPRFEDFKPIPGKPYHIQKDHVMSSTLIRQDGSDPDVYQTYWFHLMEVKGIRDEMYGARNWFEPEGIILPDPARGLTPERISPNIKIARVDPPERRVLIPPTILDPREINLRSALSAIGMI